MTHSMPAYATTNIGSVPHLDPTGITQRLNDMLDIPAWPQLPRATFLENMYTQFSAALPSLVLDLEKEKIYFDTSGDLTQAITPFYENVITCELDHFALPDTYASGFHALVSSLAPAASGWIKGQVTGPISFGLTVTDQDLRASLYHEQLADVIVKNTVMNARWQIRELKRLRPNVMLFVDEPYMASFGSAFISLGREEVTGMLDEIFEAIQADGALAGVHCCANTDWSVLLETRVDILNLDAFGYLDNLALYPQELGAFLERGGKITWGIVPNNDTIEQTHATELATRLQEGMEAIIHRAQQRGVTLPSDLGSASLLGASCGLGSTSVEIAERVIDMLAETAQALRAA